MFVPVLERVIQHELLGKICSEVEDVMLVGGTITEGIDRSMGGRVEERRLDCGLRWIYVMTMEAKDLGGCQESERGGRA